MELRGRAVQTEGGWEYQCALFVGRGPTPEAAYLAYLAGFEHRGPPLSINNADGVIESVNRLSETFNVRS